MSLALSGDGGLGNLESAVMTGALVQSATQRDYPSAISNLAAPAGVI